MALKKKDGADLRKNYPLFIESGLIVALAILIVAFRVTFPKDEPKTFQVAEQETVEVKEVQQTQQRKQPPPPPRPPVPIEKPNDEVIENTEELDFDATLDFDQPMTSEPQTEAPPEPEPQGQEEEVVPFAVIEDQPKLKGDPLEARVKYPSFAQRANIEGRVILQFIVDKQGKPKDIQVLRSPHESLAEEAMKALRDAEFTPGMQRKKPVEVRMSLPVTFRLQ